VPRQNLTRGDYGPLTALFSQPSRNARASLLLRSLICLGLCEDSTSEILLLLARGGPFLGLGPCGDSAHLRTRHTSEPLAWHWIHWPGRLVNRGGGGSSVKEGTQCPRRLWCRAQAQGWLALVSGIRQECVLARVQGLTPHTVDYEHLLLPDIRG